MKHHCKDCGYNLVLLSSQNTKYCPECRQWIDWQLDEGEVAIYGDRVLERNLEDNKLLEE